MSNYPTIINAQGIEVVSSNDGAWATYLAAGQAQLATARAEGAEAAHKIEMAKAEGLHALNSVRFDGDIRAAARVLYDADPTGPSIDEMVEVVIIPIREKYLASFESQAPANTHSAGPNEMAFNLLTGEGK